MNTPNPTSPAPSVPPRGFLRRAWPILLTLAAMALADQLPLPTLTRLGLTFLLALALACQLLSRRAFLIGLAITVALMAAYVVPDGNHYLQRGKATACKQDLRTLDLAIAQWAAENGKRPDDPVTLTDLQVYLRAANPALRERGEDSLGHPIPFDGTGPHVPAATKEATKEVVGDAFWSSYN